MEEMAEPSGSGMAHVGIRLCRGFPINIYLIPQVSLGPLKKAFKGSCDLLTIHLFAAVTSHCSFSVKKSSVGIKNGSLNNAVLHEITETYQLVAKQGSRQLRLMVPFPL